MVKKWLKKHKLLYNIASFFRFKEARIQFLLRRLIRYPQLHCSFLVNHSTMYGYGIAFPRDLRIDLKNPKYFNEKMLWLKYYVYNKSSLVAKCYDKYTVREYVKDCGCEDILNDLYGVWDDVNNIPWDELPDEYIIKKTNGCGNHIIKRHNEEIDIEEAKTLLTQSDYFERKKFIASGDLFATKMPQKYVCEKLLQPRIHEERVDDYKFYCFNGKPLFLNYIWGRKLTDKNAYYETFKRIDLDNGGALVDQSDYILHAVDVNMNLPLCYPKMIDVCEKLSKPFPFVRVDLYAQGEKVVFGELTFTPEGSHMLDHVYRADYEVNTKGLLELGNLLIINSAE